MVYIQRKLNTVSTNFGSAELSLLKIILANFKKGGYIEDYWKTRYVLTVYLTSLGWKGYCTDAAKIFDKNKN